MTAKKGSQGEGKHTPSKPVYLMLPAARQTVSMWSSRCAFSGAEGERYSGFWASLAEAPRGGASGWWAKLTEVGEKKDSSIQLPINCDILVVLCVRCRHRRRRRVVRPATGPAETSWRLFLEDLVLRITASWLGNTDVDGTAKGQRSGGGLVSKKKGRA